ncbi:hypothetical protein HDU89_001251 [Geranomyces variabilis]|nr:hypothetical protein HDU89_001251 [Geranomyces variabilis]
MDVHYSLILAGNQLPVAFLRYNPDAFQVDGTTRRIRKKDREAKLVDVLRHLKFDTEFEIKYMYFNVNRDGTLTLYDDPAYSQWTKV